MVKQPAPPRTGQATPEGRDAESAPIRNGGGGVRRRVRAPTAPRAASPPRRPARGPGGGEGTRSRDRTTGAEGRRQGDTEGGTRGAAEGRRERPAPHRIASRARARTDTFPHRYGGERGEGKEGAHRSRDRATGAEGRRRTGRPGGGGGMRGDGGR